MNIRPGRHSIGALVTVSGLASSGGDTEQDYLPGIYVRFLERFPEIAEAQGALARAVRERNPFDARADRLIKLAMAVGAEAEGAVRSNVRKALQHGATVDDVNAVALAAVTTCGFPTAIAALGWIEDVLAAPGGQLRGAGAPATTARS